MADFVEAKQALEAGKHVSRKGANFKHSSFFLKLVGGKKYLFVQSVRPHSGEVVESPATFDWDDISATTWRVL